MLPFVTEPDVARLRDHAAVAAAVAEWATVKFGTPAAVAASESLGGGLDNYVHAFRLTGEGLPAVWRDELVVRVAPSADRLDSARTEMQIQNWIADQGYPAARVLAVLFDDWQLAMPAQVAMRAPGRQLLDAVKQQPFRVVRLIRLLATLHADLHSLPSTNWPSDRSVGQAAEWRLRLIRTRVATGDQAMSHRLRDVEQRIAWCREHPIDTTVCHGDFHPLNVVFDQRSLGAVVVDWTDSTVDDPHSDVARTATLFRLAAIAGNNATERFALRLAGPLLAAGYLRAYGKRRSLDPARLHRWESLHLLNGWAQLSSLQDNQLQSSANGQDFPPWLVRSIRRRLDKTLRTTC
jgi:aminoglycoside phosphotransferase (APT) family kinase protein